MFNSLWNIFLDIGFIGLIDVKQIAVAFETYGIPSCPSFEYVAESKYAIFFFFIFIYIFFFEYILCILHTVQEVLKSVLNISHVPSIEIRCGHYEGKKTESFCIVLFPVFFGLEKQILSMKMEQLYLYNLNLEWSNG